MSDYFVWWGSSDNSGAWYMRGSLDLRGLYLYCWVWLILSIPDGQQQTDLTVAYFLRHWCRQKLSWYSYAILHGDEDARQQVWFIWQTILSFEYLFFLFWLWVIGARTDVETRWWWDWIVDWLLLMLRWKDVCTYWA